MRFQWKRLTVLFKTRSRIARFCRRMKGEKIKKEVKERNIAEIIFAADYFPQIVISTFAIRNVASDIVSTRNLRNVISGMWFG